MVLGYEICKLIEYKNGYDGNIVVSSGEEKIIYSLELNEDPEPLQFKKKVIFKIVVPDEESFRE
jgi:hypothetical protein